ncbi:MAG: hypothetical protein HKN36_05955 [Hellea sp.]|nr:hypothetical protein [Hellea sp.]
MDNLPNIAFDPLIAMPLIWLILALAFIAAAMSGLSRLKSFFLRALSALFLTLALLNPQTVEEDKDPLADELLIITDNSESAELGDRKQKMNTIIAALSSRLESIENLEVTRVQTGDNQEGTKLASSLVEALSNMPQNRLAGVIAITDGQIHDIPVNPEGLLPDGVPLHALIMNDTESRDRRISAILAPRYGLVGEQTDFQVRVDDPGFEGDTAVIQIRVNGELIARFPATIGNRVSIPITIEKRGTNTVELNVVAAPDELTLKNNIFVSEISGIRDKMQVLLITGEPHRGGRAWRNLLKSDPAVEMVHFTILTIPDVKERVSGQDELSLIEFPTAQLFEEKLDEFDLIIFDNFTRRSSRMRGGRSRELIQPFYIQNIANYVEDGGALLVATGPGFAGDKSLYRTALAGVLPARPTGKISEFAYQAQLSDKGRRHPVTSSFAGSVANNWGQWFRIIESEVVAGHVLMEGPNGEPLLIMEKVVDGRVGMLMSDQAWLWSRNYDGGGPYSELFRRMAHWLLGEPDLDAEKLTAKISGDELVVERMTLGETAQDVTVRKPDGSTETIKLNPVSDGIYRGIGKTAGQGAYLLDGGDVNAVTALGALNPREYKDLTTTDAIIRPLSELTGGGTYVINKPADIPNMRRVRPGNAMSDASWMGLVENRQFVTRNSRRKPLAPALLFFALAIAALAWAWRREGQ